VQNTVSVGAVEALKKLRSEQANGEHEAAEDQLIKDAKLVFKAVEVTEHTATG
jgi:hypothetical protein